MNRLFKKFRCKFNLLGDWEIGRLGDWEIGRLGFSYVLFLRENKTTFPFFKED
jgi:hypothetical protein